MLQSSPHKRRGRKDIAMKEATLITFVYGEDCWKPLIRIDETTDTKVYKENIPKLKDVSLKDVVKRAKLLQNLYSTTKVEIEEFCQKYPQYSWKCSFRETINQTTYHKISTEYPLTVEQLHEKVCKYAEITTNTVKVGDFFTYNRIFSCEEERKKLQKAGIKIGENAVKLDNGKIMINDYGKYASGITFIVSPGDLPYYEYLQDKDLKESLNVIWQGTPEFMYGKYWKSKKGSNCFSPCSKKYAKHLLVRLDWGGCFNNTRGYTELQNTLYYKRASSNGGGSGYTYFVIPAESHNTYSEEDL